MCQAQGCAARIEHTPPPPPGIRMAIRLIPSRLRRVTQPKAGTHRSQNKTPGCKVYRYSVNLPPTAQDGSDHPTCPKPMFSESPSLAHLQGMPSGPRLPGRRCRLSRVILGQTLGLSEVQGHLVLTAESSDGKSASRGRCRAAVKQRLFPPHPCFPTPVCSILPVSLRSTCSHRAPPPGWRAGRQASPPSRHLRFFLPRTPCDSPLKMPHPPDACHGFPVNDDAVTAHISGHCSLPRAISYADYFMRTFIGDTPLPRLQKILCSVERE